MARPSRAGVAATCQRGLRLTPAEDATLVALAAARGVKPTDLVRAWIALAAGGVLVPAAAPLPGHSADPSLEGGVRWLLDILGQIPPAKVRALPGGASLLTAATDLRARQVAQASPPAASSPATLDQILEGVANLATGGELAALDRVWSAAAAAGADRNRRGLAVACPVEECEAKPGERCTDLVEGYEVRQNRRPHDARVKLGPGMPSSSAPEKSQPPAAAPSSSSTSPEAVALAALPAVPQGWRREPAPYDGTPPTPAEVLAAVVAKPATYDHLTKLWPKVRGAHVGEQLRQLLNAKLAGTRRSDRRYFATPAAVAAVSPPAIDNETRSAPIRRRRAAA